MRKSKNDMKKNEIATAAALAALEVLEVLGLSSGEITRARALRTYGQAFLDLEAAGLVRPVRGDASRYCHRFYRVADILAARAAAQAEAQAQLAEIR